MAHGVVSDTQHRRHSWSAWLLTVACTSSTFVAVWGVNQHKEVILSLCLCLYLSIIYLSIIYLSLSFSFSLSLTHSHLLLKQMNFTWRCDGLVYPLCLICSCQLQVYWFKLQIISKCPKIFIYLQLLPTKLNLYIQPHMLSSELADVSSTQRCVPQITPLWF